MKKEFEMTEHAKNMQRVWNTMGTVVKAIVTAPITRAQGGISYDNEHYVKARDLGFTVNGLFGRRLKRAADGSGRAVMDEIFAYGGYTGAKRTYTKGGGKVNEIYMFDTREDNKDVLYMMSKKKSEFGSTYYDVVRLCQGKANGFVIGEDGAKTAKGRAIIDLFESTVANFNAAQEVEAQSGIIC